MSLQAHTAARMRVTHTLEQCNANRRNRTCMGPYTAKYAWAITPE